MVLILPEKANCSAFSNHLIINCLYGYVYFVYHQKNLKFQPHKNFKFIFIKFCSITCFHSGLKMRAFEKLTKFQLTIVIK